MVHISKNDLLDINDLQYRIIWRLKKKIFFLAKNLQTFETEVWLGVLCTSNAFFIKSYMDVINSNI